MAYPISLTSECSHICEESEGTAYVRGLFLLVTKMSLSLDSPDRGAWELLHAVRGGKVGPKG